MLPESPVTRAACVLFLLATGSAGAAVACGSDHSSPVPVAARKLDQVPSFDGLEGLDPEAVASVRRAAEALAADIERPGGWTDLGAALHAHGRLELARTCYEQRVLRDPEDPRTWYWLALIEEERGESGRAIAHLGQCVRREPRYLPGHWRRGLLHLRQGELEPAETAMRAALDLAPHDAAAVVGMARVRLQQGAPGDAAALLEEHLRRLPTDQNARMLLGTAYRELGRVEDATRVMTGAAGAEPVRKDPWRDEMLTRRLGYRTDFLRAVDRLEQGAVAEAIGLLEKLHARRPDDTLVHLSLHRAYRMNGELGRAIELLQEALRIDPLMDVIHLHLAGAERERAHRTGSAPDRAALARALASSEAACELSPNFPEAQGMRGDVLADLGRDAEALEAYLRAADLAPDASMWQEKAGLALCRAGRWAEAVPRLRRLAALQPRSARTLLQLAAALANSGELEEAHGHLVQARALAPRDPVIEKALLDLERNRAGGGG